MRPAVIREMRRWLPAVGAALLGALPWLYLVLRGAAGARLAAPELATLDGLLAHVTARGFSGDMFYYHTPADLAARLPLIGQALVFQWHGLVLVLAIAALLILAWRDRWLLLALGAPLALHALITATYRAPQTIEYLIPAYVCLAAAVGWAVGYALSAGQRYPVLRLAPALTLTAAVLSGWPCG